MKKGKSITLLSILGVIMALLIFITFARFPVGINNFNSVLGAIETDYDLSGGTAYTLNFAKDNTEEVEDIEEVISTIEDRLESLGHSSYSVKALRSEGELEENYSIRIEVKASTSENGEPDYTTLDADIETATKYGELEFFGSSEADPSEEDRILDGVQVIKSAKYQEIDAQHVVEISFTDQAYDVIVENMGTASYYLKITLGGKVLKPFDGTSTNSINSSNFSQTVYLTAASESAARQMVLQITSGGLAYKFDEPVRINEVSSPYGANTELFCIIAVASLIVLSIVALLVLYKGFGLISGLSLVLFILIELAMLIAVPGIKVGIGGVLGIILATVLTLDGFIITAKRIKEESSTGKTLKASVKTGFRRALLPIVNSGVISVIVALLLFAFTSGVVRNFAVTFGIGVAVSLISTVLFNRMFTSLILAVVKNKEAFLNINKVEE